MTTTQIDSRIKIEKPDVKRLKELSVEDWAIWTKEPSDFDWHYDDRETCYFLEGKVIVKTDRGQVEIGKGDLVTFERGLDCHWTVVEAVRKHYSFG
ncbi:MAG TPA: cupin domain-containing protein [Candidatus Obscuribacterales bacterium]